MVDTADELIKFHEEHEPHESDESTRAAAAARLWATGDKENRKAARAIWHEVGAAPHEISAFKQLMRRLKKKR